MFLKPSLDSKISDFWKWFATNSSRFRIQGSIEEELCDELEHRIQKIDRDLTFEISPSDNSPFELVVSADGKKKAFPIVTAVVAAAPLIPSWKVTAFRQRTPLDSIELSFNGITLSPTTVSYVLIPDEGELDMLIIMPDTDEEMQDHVFGAGFLLLDAALGEYDVATKLRTIEFANHSEIDPAVPLRPLLELPIEFDEMFGSTS